MACIVIGLTSSAFHEPPSSNNEEVQFVDIKSSLYETMWPIQRIYVNPTKVLAYSLEKTHPKGKSVLPSFLLLLPSLREISMHNAKSLKSVQERFNPDLSPLLFDMLPVTIVTAVNRDQPNL